MPRPPLPKLTAHSSELRARSLRVLLEIVREKYPQQWGELTAEARAAAGDAEALMDALERWLRARRLLDDDALAVFAALEALVQDVQELRRGAAAKALLFATLRGFVPRTAQPEPVFVEVKYLLGEGMPWAFGLQFEEMRARILADFTAKLDAALAQYRRNCEAAGLAEAAVSPAERERLELLAEYLVENKTAAELADARRQSSDARVRADLKAAAEACALHLRARGRQVQRKTAQKTRE